MLARVIRVLCLDVIYKRKQTNRYFEILALRKTLDCKTLLCETRDCDVRH